MFLRDSKKDGYIQVSEIAEVTKLPKAYLSKIAKILVNEKYLLSKRGKNGGVMINPENKNTSFLSICEILDEPFVKNECVLFSKICNSNAPCAMHKEFTKGKQKLLDYLKNEKI